MLLNNIKNLILEMAFERSRAESKITELAIPVLFHIIKILKWEDSINYSKHVEDINTWLFDIQRILIKPRSRRFKPELYYIFLFEEQIKSIFDITLFINRDLRKYKNLKELNSDEIIYEKLIKFYKQLSIDISINQFNGIENYETFL